MMKTKLCERRSGAAIVSLAMVALLLIHPSPARVGNVASAQSGSGERTTKPAPKKIVPKTSAPPKKTVAAPKRAPTRLTPRQPSCSAQSPTRGTGREYSETLSGGAKLEMVEIPGGNFCMGSPESEAGRSSEEGPQHRVTVRSFYLGKYEVTQAQWQAVMGTNSSKFEGDNLPVDNVSWSDATEFCRKLSQMTGRAYRLPTEAEWEYACRAGTTTPFSFGSSLSSEQANFDGNYAYGEAAKGLFRNQTTPVGSFPPNSFGLYDMHGNVYEWCQDWYHEDYKGAPGDGSAWESGPEPQSRMQRGGSYYSGGSSCRSAYRFRYTTSSRSTLDGLRVVALGRI